MSCGGCGRQVKGVSVGCGGRGKCVSRGCNKLEVFDWLSNIKPAKESDAFPYVEVRFKNSRKEFFHSNHLQLSQGDVVAVEAASGHDIGVVSLTGELVRLQMKKRGIEINSREFKKVYRKAKEQDIKKWIAARELEVPTMLKARTIASSLNLQMKISDVEYQGDKSKATFYYTADERVDFRELIKKLAAEFKVKIEMRQIGARQEASRLGGIGSCGRELCCSTWLTDFRTVNTSAARYQQLSFNPAKLAGQCGKLKCCLNYELDAYVEVYKEFPDTEIILQTVKGNAKHQKSDIFKRLMWYAYENDNSTLYPLSIERVKEIIELNKNGVKPEALEDLIISPPTTSFDEPDYENVVGQDSLDRFNDKLKQNEENKHKNKKNKSHQTVKKVENPQNLALQSPNSRRSENRSTKNRSHVQNQSKPSQKNNENNKTK